MCLYWIEFVCVISKKFFSAFFHYQKRKISFVLNQLMKIRTFHFD